MKDWGITEDTARKVLTVIDAGLVRGVGNPTPGQMCIEAAVNYALGLPHGDEPECVSRALRALKISLNDKEWSSDAARAKGLRRLGLAQLGSRDHLDDIEFARRVSALAIRTCVPTALRTAASGVKNPKHKQAMLNAANKCEREAMYESALEARYTAAAVFASNAAYVADAACASIVGNAAYAGAFAVAAADAVAAVEKSARDKALADFAEGVVQILIEMKAPGCQWLVLTEAA